MEAEILENLKKAVIECDADGAASWASKSVQEGIDPNKALDALIEGISQVGDGFAREQLWLPDLISAAEAMQSAIPIIEADLLRKGQTRKTIGTVVLGTVEGDIHDIGKNIVGTMLTVSGFAVHDLGVDVSAERFVEAVREHRPHILGMSALLNISVPAQGKVIGQLAQAGLRSSVKVMVGGAAVTPEYARRIGAEAYGEDAAEAVKVARRLIGLEEAGG